jgi:hypothetical protein
VSDKPYVTGDEIEGETEPLFLQNNLSSEKETIEIHETLKETIEVNPETSVEDEEWEQLTLF